MGRMSLLQLRSILLQNVTMFIFVVINFNAAFPSFFFEEGGGGGGGRRLGGKSAYAQHQGERRGPSLERG